MDKKTSKDDLMITLIVERLKEANNHIDSFLNSFNIKEIELAIKQLTEIQNYFKEKEKVL